MDINRVQFDDLVGSSRAQEVVNLLLYALKLAHIQ